MIDTHCHLNFKAFKKTLPDVILRARSAGITDIIIPGTDVKTSKRGVEIAAEHDSLYAAVGIHPHHAFKLLENPERSKEQELSAIEELLSHPKVVAVGEVGLDRHEYESTVYTDYAVDGAFISLQKELLIRQIQFAVKHKKSLILHNREAVTEMLPILEEHWDSVLEGHTVFHCCEPREEILEFAKKHHIYLGVDGDITYTKEKQDFLPRIPVEMLVLETDSPFLLPEPLKTARKYPNEPQNIVLFLTLIGKLLNISPEELERQTSENAKALFQLS